MTNSSKSKFVKHEPCPSCGSSDALARYDDGSAYCFAAGCNHFEKATGEVVQLSTRRKTDMKGVCADIPDRRISKQTCEKFGVTVEFGTDGKVSKHHYPYYATDSDSLLGSKVRLVDNKNFLVTGTFESAGLFGQNTCRGRGKYITVCEGEIDALSISEMFDRKWDVVSLRSGASAAAKEVKEQLEFLEGYDNIVLCFDNDKAGETAIDAVKDVFSPNKVRICRLPLKDANEMLVANRQREFQSTWWDSKVYQPDGIIAGADTWDSIINKMSVKSIPYPWNGLTEITKGFRPYELVTITSGSGMGKSQIVRELEYYLLQATEDNIGILALEEDIARTALGVMSIAADCPLHLEEDLDPDSAFPYWEKTLGTGRYFMFDHWGSTSEDKLLARVRHMAKALDCKWIILDHLSIVVSAQENNDERKAIDAIMTNLRTLVQELGIGLFLVSHLKRTTGKPHEDGGKISLSELRGSQAIAQLSDMVIGLERNQQDEDEDRRNTTTVRVLKNRYAGLTGPACYLKYDKFTGRMGEVAPPKDLDSDF